MIPFDFATVYDEEHLTLKNLLTRKCYYYFNCMEDWILLSIINNVML